MRPIGRALAISVMLLVFGGAVAAQEPPPTVLPPITVRPPPSMTPAPSNEAGAPRTAAPTNCAAAESGSPEALNCLNVKLKRQVDEINPGLAAPSAPLDARSPDTKIGIVNVPAVQQQYGQNFGVSVIPYRPPALIYSSPLGHH